MTSQLYPVIKHDRRKYNGGFVRLVFDNNPHWRAGIYRTPSTISALSHKALVLKKKELPIIEEKKGFSR